MAVTYRVNAISAFMARRLIQVKHVAMVNLLAGRTLVPELLQQDCNPRLLADTVLGLLRDPQAAADQRAGFRHVIASLRPGTDLPSYAAARNVLAMLDTPVTTTAGPRKKPWFR
jgi:lipid-A-disaccharide synthase